MNTIVWFWLIMQKCLQKWFKLSRQKSLLFFKWKTGANLKIGCAFCYVVMPLLHTCVHYECCCDWRTVLLGYCKFILLSKTVLNNPVGKPYAEFELKNALNFSILKKHVTSMCFSKLWYESTLFRALFFLDKILIPRLNCILNICYVTGLSLDLDFLLFCILIDSKIFNLSEISHDNGDFLFFGLGSLYIFFFFFVMLTAFVLLVGCAGGYML